MRKELKSWLWKKPPLPPLGHMFDSLKYADIFLAPPRNRQKKNKNTSNKSEMWFSKTKRKWSELRVRSGGLKGNEQEWNGKKQNKQQGCGATLYCLTWEEI